ncbi:hypothetical protein F751_0575 [Auxenochlorella protothecoides]|uniref:Uncharacterized protein n=1 Tax=Auxenochlorella protothecoides TaxID=3075 RepID=A0A087SIJ4_AUXPR|nr:hypothetical protein F751_0575 [Auxenochlorella protothecoides]KFM25548.1 hypothetical protein F751_0575 [Auxenochlorella protothecoides]
MHFRAGGPNTQRSLRMIYGKRHRHTNWPNHPSSPQTYDCKDASPSPLKLLADLPSPSSVLGLAVLETPAGFAEGAGSKGTAVPAHHHHASQIMRIGHDGHSPAGSRACGGRC